MSLLNRKLTHNSIESAFFGKTGKNLSKVVGFLSDYNDKNFAYQRNINWHGVQVKFYFQSKQLTTEFENYFPSHWSSLGLNSFQDISVYIYDDQAQGLNDSFWLETNPDCFLYQDGEAEWACQRDFVAKKINNIYTSVCRNSISDGFFNLMRWVLPRIWLTHQKFLFHSSCVLDNNGLAYLCLGPSGAGKTTISKFLPSSQVLGDDMNLLSIDKDEKVWITPSLLGQKYEHSDLFGKKFLLKQIFWLKKGVHNKITQNSEISLKLKICMSLVNIFWASLSEADHRSISFLISSLEQNYNISELEFSLDKGVWDYVFR